MGEVMRKRLLCATDLTTRSEGAMRRAAQLATRMNAQVLFLHAVNDSQSGRVVRMKMNRARLRLLSQAERAMKNAPEDVSIAVRLGKPLEAITAAAQEWSPDLIVTAAPRRRRLDRLLGTTAERVIRATRRPVLVVNGAADESYDNLVLATDLSPASVNMARALAEMSMFENAYACVVHAFQPPYHGMTTTAAEADEEAAERRRQWRDAVSREFVSELGKAGLDLLRVHVSAEAARPLHAIQHALHRARPQLLVIGVSRWFMLKRIVFGSVADQVFRNVDCDVLAIPPTTARKTWLRAA